MNPKLTTMDAVIAAAHTAIDPQQDDPDADITVIETILGDAASAAILATAPDLLTYQVSRTLLDRVNENLSAETVLFYAILSTVMNDIWDSDWINHI